MSTPRLKPFEISKEVVWQAYLRVKANKGAAGVDGESIAEFEADLKGNLYKLWLCRAADYAESSVLGRHPTFLRWGGVRNALGIILTG